MVKIRGKAIRPPPGTKGHPHLPQEDDNPSAYRIILPLVVIAALAIGMVIGRFLLP